MLKGSSIKEKKCVLQESDKIGPKDLISPTEHGFRISPLLHHQRASQRGARVSETVMRKFNKVHPFLAHKLLPLLFSPHCEFSKKPNTPKLFSVCVHVYTRAVFG